MYDSCISPYWSRIEDSRLGLGIGHGWTWWSDCREPSTSKWGELGLSLSARLAASALFAAAAVNHHLASAELQSTDLETSEMVQLVATNRILAAWNAVPAERRPDLDLPTSLDLHGPIAHSQLLRLSKYLQNDPAYISSIASNEPKDPTCLSTLLRGTKVYIPPPQKSQNLYVFHTSTTTLEP